VLRKRVREGFRHLTTLSKVGAASGSALNETMRERERHMLQAAAEAEVTGGGLGDDCAGQPTVSPA